MRLAENRFETDSKSHAMRQVSCENMLEGTDLKSVPMRFVRCLGVIWLTFFEKGGNAFIEMGASAHPIAQFLL